MRTSAFGVTLALTVASLTGPAQAHPPTTQVNVWVTTPDRAELLHQRAPVAFQDAASDRTTITVDPRTSYQTMDGFGASITDSSALSCEYRSPSQPSVSRSRRF